MQQLLSPEGCKIQRDRTIKQEKTLHSGKGMHKWTNMQSGQSTKRHPEQDQSSSSSVQKPGQTSQYLQMQKLQPVVDCLFLTPEAANTNIIYSSIANTQVFVLDLIRLQLMLWGALGLGTVKEPSKSVYVEINIILNTVLKHKHFQLFRKCFQWVESRNKFRKETKQNNTTTYPLTNLTN